jgi:hypothetical protein
MDGAYPRDLAPTWVSPEIAQYFKYFWSVAGVPDAGISLRLTLIGAAGSQDFTKARW